MAFKIEVIKPVVAETVLKFDDADGIIRFNKNKNRFEFDYQDGHDPDSMEWYEWLDGNDVASKREVLEGLLALLNKTCPPKKSKKR